MNLVSIAEALFLVWVVGWITAWVAETIVAIKQLHEQGERFEGVQIMRIPLYCLKNFFLWIPTLVTLINHREEIM